MKIPVTVCLFTSTKGHFQIRTRYLETIQSLNDNLPLSEFARRVAHIKVTPGEESIQTEMEEKLKGCGFEVISTVGIWSHGGNDNSHQTEYLKDIYKLFAIPSVQAVPYSLFLEDDMKIVVRNGDLEKFLAKSINILEGDPNVVSVRIARAKNEMQRIIGLKAKHGINSLVWPAPNNEKSYFLASDYSNNPHICRSRDMRNAMLLLKKIGGFPQHSEHGTAMAMKLFSNSQVPIAIFNPEDIVARHIGTESGNEEPLDRDIELT